jgi:uncharacterized membrane protein
MLDKLVAGILGTIVLGIALTALWGATDQIVNNSSNQQLQTTYNVGKNMINTAETVEDAKDNFGFLKSVVGLALIIGVPATIIRAIKG